MKINLVFDALLSTAALALTLATPMHAAPVKTGRLAMRTSKWSIGVSTAVVLMAAAQAAPVLDANFEGPFNFFADNGELYRAQTFTILQSGRFTRFEAKLEGVGTSLFEIWNVSSGFPAAVPSTALASATVAFNTLNGSGFFGADISSFALDVTAGDLLALVQIGGSSSGLGAWGNSDSVPYSGGQSFTTMPDAPIGAWRSLIVSATGGDLGFKTFVDPDVTEVPEPATLALVALGLLGAIGARRRLDER